MDEFIKMDHGSGGVKTGELIDEIIRPAFSNPALNALGDGAILDISGFGLKSGVFGNNFSEGKFNGDALSSSLACGNIAFSTDSFVIDPLFFPGGNIGKLAVCGTANDIAMCGARPLWMSLSLIMEEGLPIESLKQIIESISVQAAELGVQIVTGDTKVVERGKGDGIYINTAGIGVLEYAGLTPDAIEAGDRIIVSGPIGDHGTAIMIAREDLGIESGLKSDCMALYPLAKAAWEAGNGGVHCLRDATRGGVVTTLNEFTEGRSYGIQLNEADLPVRPEVKAACSMLGLDPLYCANEGRMLCAVKAENADAVLKAIKACPGGEGAAIIGRAADEYAGRVVLKNHLGANRILTKLTGAQLPRIC